MPENKKTIVIHKKLIHKGVYGLAHFDQNKIEIDPNQSNEEYLDTMIHEKLHLILPHYKEETIVRISTQLSEFLWDNGYRQVKL